jgi:hypothetical protein
MPTSCQAREHARRGGDLLGQALHHEVREHEDAHHQHASGDEQARLEQLLAAETREARAFHAVSLRAVGRDQDARSSVIPPR